MTKYNDNKFKLIDLFAGAGGLSNGFEQTGRFEVVGAVEVNKDAAETYIYNHCNDPDIIIKPKSSDISDIKKIDFKEFLNKNNIDGTSCVVIGGPPCQGFSNANRQKNYLISGNNQLVKEFVRAIDEIRPIALLMENVEAITSKKHKFFVTEDYVEGTKFYSSLKHLDKIGVGYKEDSLVILDTVNIDLFALIKNLLSKEMIAPLINSEIQLARIRSIVRSLKKEKVFKVSKHKEKQEIQSIITELVRFDTEIIELKGLIDAFTSVLELILNNKNENNEKCLEVILRFEDVNQFLRHKNEVREEAVFCIGDPKVKSERSRLLVTIQVLSYSVVEYLEIYFKYLGYNIAPKVMLASDFCVPQNRSRYMILGVRKGAIKDNQSVEMPDKIQSEKLPFSVFEAIGDLEEIEPVSELSDRPLDYITSTHTEMRQYFRSNMKINVVYNHINTASGLLARKRFLELKETGGRNFHSLSPDLKEISYTDYSRTQNTIYLRLNYNTPSPTVVNVRKSMWQHPEKPQALSIREAARLQSFKDNFIFKGTKDKQYQQIGNAVPPLLARAVAEQLLKIIGEEPIFKMKDEFMI